MTKSVHDQPTSLKTLCRLGSNEELPLRHFDDVCKLVAEHFRVPVAVISLTDGDRQYFVGQHGTECRVTHVQGSISSHAVAHDGVLVVEDARGDPRFSACPLVAGDLRIRLYAGVPLTQASGMRLGTLFVADQQPATFHQSDCEALKAFADLAAAKLSCWESELRADAQKRDLDQQQAEGRAEKARSPRRQQGLACAAMSRLSA
ncbi:MAG: GAF domain-containing protein [bacterium]